MKYKFVNIYMTILLNFVYKGCEYGMGWGYIQGGGLYGELSLFKKVNIYDVSTEYDLI